MRQAWTSLGGTGREAKSLLQIQWFAELLGESMKKGSFLREVGRKITGQQ
jgi:hypothetical protein